MANPWDNDPIISAAPQAGNPYIVPPDPTKVADHAAQQQREAAAASQAAAREQRAAAEWAATHNPDGTPKSDVIGIPPDLMHLTGPDFLAKLSPTDQAQIKALTEGRMAFPTGKAAASPYWQQRIAEVAQYDPTFDAINYNARAGVRRDFTSGKSAANIKALNTAIGHLGQLGDQIGGTASHGGFPFATDVNAVQNWWNRKMGDPGVTNYEQTAGALAGELTQVYRQSGGAEADIQRYLKELDSAASEDQKKAAVANMTGLLKSRLDALNDQYDKGMGIAAGGLEVLDPHSIQVLSTYMPGFKPPSTGDATASPNLSPGQASHALSDAQAFLHRQTDALPPQAQQVGQRQFYSDPHTLALQAPQDAQGALDSAQAQFNQQVAKLPPAARAVGQQQFDADPRIKALRAAAARKAALHNAPRAGGAGGGQFLGFE